MTSKLQDVLQTVMVINVSQEYYNGLSSDQLIINKTLIKIREHFGWLKCRDELRPEDIKKLRDKRKINYFAILFCVEKFCRFGLPKRIYSYRERNFGLTLFQNVCKLIDIKNDLYFFTHNSSYNNHQVIEVLHINLMKSLLPMTYLEKKLCLFVEKLE